MLWKFQGKRFFIGIPAAGLDDSLSQAIRDHGWIPFSVVRNTVDEMHLGMAQAKEGGENVVGLGGTFDPDQEGVSLAVGNEGADTIEEWTDFTPGEGNSPFWKDPDSATIAEGTQGLPECIKPFPRAINRDQLEPLPDGFHPVPHVIISHHPADHEGALGGHQQWIYGSRVIADYDEGAVLVWIWQMLEPSDLQPVNKADCNLQKPPGKPDNGVTPRPTCHTGKEDQVDECQESNPSHKAKDSPTKPVHSRRFDE
jgi:hypothetical protein